MQTPLLQQSQPAAQSQAQVSPHFSQPLQQPAAAVFPCAALAAAKRSFSADAGSQGIDFSSFRAVCDLAEQQLFVNAVSVTPAEALQHRQTQSSQTQSPPEQQSHSAGQLHGHPSPQSAQPAQHELAANRFCGPAAEINNPTADAMAIDANNASFINMEFLPRKNGF